MSNKYLEKISSLFEGMFHTTLHPAAKVAEDEFLPHEKKTVQQYPANQYLNKIAGLELGAGTTQNDHGSNMQQSYPTESLTKNRVVGMPSVNNDLRTRSGSAINNTNTGALISVLNGSL